MTTTDCYNQTGALVMDYVYLIADEIYILCVSGDSCQTETDYTVTVSHN